MECALADTWATGRSVKVCNVCVVEYVISSLYLLKLMRIVLDIDKSSIKFYYAKY